MRDIVQDAAIITVAQRVIADEGGSWMSVESFVQTYADSDDDQQIMRATLSLFGLATQVFEKSMWELEGRYVWSWVVDLPD